MLARFVGRMTLNKSEESARMGGRRSIGYPRSESQRLVDLHLRHCVISGAESREVSEFCTNLSEGTKLLLIVATIVIAMLIVAVFAFYQKNKR